MIPPDDSPMESLLRARAARLAAPDPAWREAILAACEAAEIETDTVAGTAYQDAPASPVSVVPAGISRPAHSPPATRGRKSWLTPRRVTTWGTLAACWIAALLLNREAQQLNASVALPYSAPTGQPFPHEALLWQSSDLAVLTWIRPPRRQHPAPPLPADAPKPSPHQSYQLPPAACPRLVA